MSRVDNIQVVRDVSPDVKTRVLIIAMSDGRAGVYLPTGVAVVDLRELTKACAKAMDAMYAMQDEEPVRE